MLQWSALRYENTPYNLRAIAAKALSSVLDQGQSLSTALPALSKEVSEKIAHCCKNFASGCYACYLSLNGIFSN